MDLPLWLIAIIAFIVINFMLVSASVLVYAERKVSAYMQNRPGPNRVGPFGFLQPFADVAKLLFKEDIVPTASNKFIHSLAPVLMVVSAKMSSTVTLLSTITTPRANGIIAGTVMAMTTISTGASVESEPCKPSTSVRLPNRSRATASSATPPVSDA